MTTLGLKQIIFHVIPAKAGIQINPGFRVKPGMTDIRGIGLMIRGVWAISPYRE